MNTIQTIIITSILGGTALIPFVDIVTKDIKNSRVSFAIALLSSLILGAVVVVLQGNMQVDKDPANWFTSLSTIFLTSQTIFNLYWKKSLLRDKLSQRIIPTIPVQPEPIAQEGDIQAPV